MRSGVAHNRAAYPLMIPRFSLFLLLFIGAAFTALARSEEIIQRHLDASPGGKLIIDVDFGNVEVTGATDDKIIGINARRTVEIGDKAREKEFVEAAPITISQDNNVITIKARSNRQWNWHNNDAQMDARYSVQLPKNFNVDLRTGGGTIEVN